MYTDHTTIYHISKYSKMASSSSSSSSMRGDAQVLDSQRFCAISFLKSRPDDTEKRFAIKVSGCFPTEDDAKSHIAKLMANDDSHDIYLMDTGKWHMAPPEDAENRDYSLTNSEKLSMLWNGYQEERQKVQEFEKRRKELLMSGDLDPSDPDGENMDFVLGGDQLKEMDDLSLKLGD